MRLCSGRQLGGSSRTPTIIPIPHQNHASTHLHSRIVRKGKKPIRQNSKNHHKFHHHHQPKLRVSSAHAISRKGIACRCCCCWGGIAGKAGARGEECGRVRTMGGWRPAAFALMPSLLLVPMMVLGFHTLAPTSAKLQQPKNLSSSDAAAACAEDLMALFSGPVRAANLSAARAEELRSCIRPLVPYHEIAPSFCAGKSDVVVPSSRRRRLQRSRQFSTADELMEVNARLLSGDGVDDDAREKVERLVQWPPSQVLNLARRTVAFGGDPAAVLSELSPTRHPVPDVENSTAERCYLTKYDYGKRFEDEVMNSYIVFLYHAISMLSPLVGFNVSLNRFDLFHGHMFTTYETNRLGILFHSREYPQYDEKIFPINLGYCQKGSKIPYDKSMDLRNILWLAPLATCTDKGVCSDDWLASGVLLILDAKEGGVVYRELIPEYLDDVRTVSEEEFGYLVADINYLNLGITPPENRVFIC